MARRKMLWAWKSGFPGQWGIPKWKTYKNYWKVDWWILVDIHGYYISIQIDEWILVDIHGYYISIQIDWWILVDIHGISIETYMND